MLFSISYNLLEPLNPKLLYIDLTLIESMKLIRKLFWYVESIPELNRKTTCKGANLEYINK